MKWLKKKGINLKNTINNIVKYYADPKKLANWERGLKRQGDGRANLDVSYLEEQLLLTRFFSPKLEMI